ncbi:MAG: proton-conducting transporter membrane subunit, partial [Betaproteobacteria bacterium]
MSGAQLIAATLLVPAAGAIGVALCGRRPDLRESVTLLSAFSMLACVLNLLPLVLAGGRPQLFVLEMLPGIALAFRVEPLGMLFALVASSLWLVNSVYSIGYMRANGEPHQTRFYACFALALSATMGIAFSANLLTLFLFYEALTLVTWPLVTHHGDDEAKKGGRIYLAFLIGTSMLFLLPAIIITWVSAGTLEFAPGGLLRGAGLSG